MRRIWSALRKRVGAIAGLAALTVTLLPAAAWATIDPLKPDDTKLKIDPSGPPTTGSGGGGSLGEVLLIFGGAALVIFIIARVLSD